MLKTKRLCFEAYQKNNKIKLEKNKTNNKLLFRKVNNSTLQYFDKLKLKKQTNK